MSSVHVARSGYITKNALPSVSRVRGTTSFADKDAVLLLNGNGTNGAQNNTFIDGSTNNFTITRNGNTTQGTFSPFSQAAGEWSNYFDGTGDYFTLADSTSWNLTGDFTIESWVYLTGYSASYSGLHGVGVLSQYLAGAGNAGWQLRINGTANSYTTVNLYTGVTDINFSHTFNLNTWYHVAVSRSGSSIRAFVDGVQIGSTITNSDNFTEAGTRQLWIGRVNDATFQFPMIGYLSNVRVVNGTAVYTSNFTPPTTPLTAITNTVLLTCRDNRFRDASTNNFTLTRNGDVRVTAFSPFAPTAAYSAGTNGGSGYFDGTGDFLNLASSSAVNFGTGDFTVEFWVYPLATTRQDWFDTWSTGPGRLLIYYSGTNIIYFNGGTLITGSAITTGQWYHIALCRSSGSTKLFVNGTQSGSTYSDSKSYPNDVVIIGKDGAGSTHATGYISNVRVVKDAQYTADFTPPTAPLTAITNTSLLLNFTNAGIIDSTGKNVLETVADAQLDTAVKQYGSASLEFDGTGDWLKIPSASPNDLFNMGTGNYTVELWVRVKSFSSQFQLVDFRTSDTTGQGVSFFVKTNRTLGIYYSFSERIISNDLLVQDTWHHVAYTRSNGVYRMFIDGVLQTQTWSNSDAVVPPANCPSIGQVASSQFANCFIDDLRITKGVARYTANFTPPTSELIVFGTVDNVVTNNIYGVRQLA